VGTLSNMSTALLVASLLAAAPLTQSRLFIAAGAKTEAEAKKALASLKLPPQLLLAPGFPKLVKSDTVGGLNPGFVLVVLGACADVSASESGHNDGLAALIQRGVKGAYAKPAAKQDAACPLWLEASKDPAVAAAKTKRDDPKALVAAAEAYDRDADLVGAAIVLRRAIALGATDEATLNLSRKVELLMEDLPTRLPP
jgi:hypothetical protein